MRRTNQLALYVTRGALIAAAYVALTFLAALFGLASGVIQFRISEALCVMALFFPEAVLGLTIGCLISNLITGALIWDVFFGSVATLIGAIGARMLRRLPDKLIFISTLPTLFANALIVPLVLMYAYGAEGAYWYFFITVGLGELVCATIGGTALYYPLKKLKLG